MLLFLSKRIFVGLLVVTLVSSLVFVITRIVTNPELAFLPIDATDAQRASVRAYLGLDKGMFSQYLSFLGNLAKGDLGDSFWQPGKSAMSIVIERIPLTLKLNAFAMTIALALAIPLGVISSLKPGTWLDRLTVSLSLVGLSAPQFWLGFLLVMFFGVRLGWFPTSGADELKSFVLPGLALALPTAGKITQIVRSAMLDEFERPYMLTARAKGLGLIDQIGRHSMRNISVTVLTQSSFELVRMIAGFTLVVESVFAWPGIGRLTIQALEQQDLMLLQAIVIVIATMIVIVNIITDILYSLIDPRIKLS
jgi:peptide/nickel transport system permease protein